MIGVSYGSRLCMDIEGKHICCYLETSILKLMIYVLYWNFEYGMEAKLCMDIEGTYMLVLENIVYWNFEHDICTIDALLLKKIKVYREKHI
jgi:hypothetical protein